MPGGARAPPCISRDQSNALCHASEKSWPVKGGLAFSGSASADAASSCTSWFAPAGEGRPTTALTAAFSDPSPLGPQPLAPGTANVLSPCTAPLTTVVPSGPLSLGVPSAGG